MRRSCGYKVVRHGPTFRLRQHTPPAEEADAVGPFLYANRRIVHFHDRHSEPVTMARRSSWYALNELIMACERCPRLRAYCQEIAVTKRRAYQTWTYWGRPLPNFGDPQASVLVVGLAPAAHGANRTGRMFTGDRSGDWLYRSLFRAGLANQPSSGHRKDGLALRGAAITAACHCAPPANKPTPAELAACQEWLEQTLEIVPWRVVVALGGIAWQAVTRRFLARGLLLRPIPRFGHGRRIELATTPPRWLLGCYHPSQQNTFTGRLTEEMLDQVMSRARELASAGDHL